MVRDFPQVEERTYCLTFLVQGQHEVRYTKLQRENRPRKYGLEIPCSTLHKTVTEQEFSSGPGFFVPILTACLSAGSDIQALNM